MSAREIPSSPGRHVEELAAFAAAKGASHPSDFVARTLPSGMTYYDYVGQPIEIQEIDKRPYRLIKLINNIEVFLVQDSDYDLATAAMLVKAGYAQDPLNLPGLAHFCEHMLFINTEKYPEAGGFDSFLSIHNGISNAYTDIDHTCYYFSIANAGLEDALDRWSQFFIKPLFDPEYVRREVNAIDSEFKTHINNNAWRLDSLLSSLANPAHPFSKFGTGNYRTLAERAESLGLCLSTEVVSFYDRYYSSDVMSLAIIGSQDIQQLTEWAVQMFSHIPSKGISTKPCSTAPFAQDALGTLVHFKTVGKKFQLSIVFPLPKINHLWKSKPLEVIKDLLEFRAGGTLFDFLKQRGWAYDISCHQESDTDDYSFLRFEVNLTEDGYRSYHDVVRSVFSYLETLRQHHIPETFFNDLRQRRINEFRFEHLDHGTDLSEFLATSFLYSFYPRHLLLSGLNMIYEYSPTDYHLVLDSLRPSNCFFMLGSQDPGVECPLREEHFGVEYCLDVIDSAFVVELEQITPYREFAIPADNRFVSYDLELVSGIERPEEPLLEPTLLLRGKHGEVWHRRDDRFFLPKGKLGIELKMPRAVRTAPDSELVIST
ncbi:metalloprotease, partial [Spiromyces aspiralis]